MPRESLAAHAHVVLQVHGGLGSPRRPRGVEPERRVVTGRGRGRELRGLRPDEIREGERVPCRLADDRDVPQESEAGANLRDGGEERGAHDRCHRAAVGQDVFVVPRREQRVRGDRYGAELDRSPEAIRELGHVGEEEEHAVSHSHAEPAQGVARAVHVLEHRPVGERAPVRDQRRVITARRGHVSVHEPGGGVAAARGLGHQAMLRARPGASRRVDSRRRARRG